MVRQSFPGLPYVNFEKPDVREYFDSDPNAFLAKYGDGAVFDEIQRVPKLSSYLQPLVDEAGRNGLFVLTGSAQFEMPSQVNQSLAGRTALLKLLPFSIDELGGLCPRTIDALLRTGFYPRIYDQGLDPSQFYADYLQTYVERDLRQSIEIQRLSQFRRFLRLCAGRIGQLVNFESLGADSGVSGVTIRHWLSVLEASYVIALLPPWFENIGKRLVKSPKLYFFDVGLASYLCGIETDEHASSHPLRGNLFENLVMMEAYKRRLNLGKEAGLHFFRDAKGMEVDLLYPDGPQLVPVEIKSAQTVDASFFDSLTKLRKLLPDRCAEGILVYGGGEAQERSQGRALPYPEFARSLPG
jgi:uncharacterized protein